MSICIVRATEICWNCAHASQVFRNGAGGILVAIEVNDMCSECIMEDEAFVRTVDYHEEEELVKKVKKHSPWHQAIVRKQRWQTLRHYAPAIFLMACCLYGAYQLGASLR